ncbi:MAG: hypothetical protein EAY69_06750 [Cytophagales bacterium]|nr:MAG: hypothetical protein EAY69_06750 [Cytophagales bacterium]
MEQGKFKKKILKDLIILLQWIGRFIKIRQIQKEDFERFDYIIAMDRSVYQNILSYKIRVSNATEINIMLMRSFDDNKGILDVPDPYYGTTKDFEEMNQILSRCMNNFLKFLKD